MRYKILGLVIVFSVVAAAGFILSPGNTTSAAASTKMELIAPTATPQSAKTKTLREITFIDGEFDGEKLVQTDDEWKKVLTSDEYYVMRQEGTERAYSGTLLKNKKVGTYHCAACGLALFSSKAKYDSQTGWPSFYKPAFKKNVTERVDRTLGEERIEIECSRCGAHLGHVFDDGPQPTGLRYCMNSISLKFKAAR